jgi:hypothetical protein
MRRFWCAALLGVVSPSLASTPPAAAAPPAAGSILFMTLQEWRRATAEEQTALAADFMRIFCTQAAMLPGVLTDCLNRTSADGTLFETALACVRRPPSQ